MLVAIDRKWWEVYHHKAHFAFRGEKISWASYNGVHRIGHLYSFRNSGAAAIAIASQRGAARVTLLGYDCSKAPDGKVHWHGNHRRPLGNAGSIDTWPARFAVLGEWLSKRSTVVQNASRRTALELFPRVDLERALEPLT